jgi:hypothetical protein
MEISELLTVLDQIKKLFAAGGAKTAEKDIAKVIKLLAPHNSKMIETFVTEFRSATAAGGSKKGKLVTPIDEAVVGQYLHRLTDVSTDQRAFDQALAALTKDSGVKLKEADAIARAFTRQQSAFKTKKAALTAIKQAFVERARFENKLKAVS